MTGVQTCALPICFPVTIPLAGMGLAVSIMIANLSYASENLLNQAKVGLLLAALASAVIGTLILIIGSRRVRN